VAGNYSFHALVSEGSNLNMSLFSVGYCKHAAAFAVQSTETSGIALSIQTVDQCKIGEVVNVSFDRKYDDHSTIRYIKD